MRTAEKWVARLIITDPFLTVLGVRVCSTSGLGLEGREKSALSRELWSIPTLML